MKKQILLFSLFWLVLNLILKPVLADDNNDIILPLKFSRDGTPIISIQIQNHNIPLIFDSGAQKISIALSKYIVNNLHLKILPTKNKVRYFDGTGKINCYKVYIIPELKIGNTIMHNIPCHLIDKIWGGHDGKLVSFEALRNGVVGLDLLRKFNVLIDYQARYIIVNKLSSYPARIDFKNWLQIPFYDRYGITTKAQINGKKTILVWDTGANVSVINRTSKLLKAVQKKSCADKNNQHCRYFETKSIAIGGKKLPKMQFFIPKNLTLPFDGLIGSSFFKKHIVFFDFKNKLIFIKH
jgi:hypothetical protein